MRIKKALRAKTSQPLSASRGPFPHQRLNALLHTIRCIVQYEGVLCELSHELQGASTLSESACEELREILEQIPSHDYLDDLDSVRAMLRPEPTKRLAPKTAATSPTVKKKRPVRTSS